MTILLGALAAAQAGSVIVGVNSWYTPPNMSPDDMVKQLAENGVKTFRISLFPNSVDFVIKAYQRGVGAVVIVYPSMGSKAKPKRSWADAPLSEVKPQEFAGRVDNPRSPPVAAGSRCDWSHQSRRRV